MWEKQLLITCSDCACVSFHKLWHQLIDAHIMNCSEILLMFSCLLWEPSCPQIIKADVLVCLGSFLHTGVKEEVQESPCQVYFQCTEVQIQTVHTFMKTDICARFAHILLLCYTPCATMLLSQMQCLAKYMSCLLFIVLIHSVQLSQCVVIWNWHIVRVNLWWLVCKIWTCIYCISFVSEWLISPSSSKGLHISCTD